MKRIILNAVTRPAVSFLCCKLVAKRVSHVEYIYALCIPTSEWDHSQTNIHLRGSHKLTVTIKKPTKQFFLKKIHSGFFHDASLKKYLFAICVYIRFCSHSSRCFVYNHSSLLWICNSMSWEMTFSMVLAMSYTCLPHHQD